MGSALQAPGAPEISHGIPGVPPPAALYVGPNETLVVDSWAYAAQLPVFIKIRMLRPGGYVDTTVYTHQPNSDRSLHTTYHDLAEGHLLTAMVYAPDSGYHRGQVWMNVGLERGSGAVGVYHHQLISDYVTNCSSPVWPWARMKSSVEGPGNIRSVAGADPAAGAEVLITVPAGARWRLYSIFATLVTDATVVDRWVRWVIDDGANTLWRLGNPIPQTAGTTRGHVAAAWGGLVTTTGGDVPTSVPPTILLSAGYRISTLTTGIVAGDNWGAPRVLVEEWIEP